MGGRHQAREWALQFLFQFEFNRTPSLEEDLALFWQNQDAGLSLAPDAGRAAALSADAGQLQRKARRFAEELIRGVLQHQEQIDSLIARHAENWDINRMGAVDRNVMRIAVFEMLRRPDIPPVVSINEAVELAKTYGSMESGKFVNGILDRIRQDINRPAREIHPQAPPPPH